MSAEKCGQYAAFRYTWPGRDESHICMLCAPKLLEVANAIGLHLQLIPIAYKVGDPIPTEFATCQQNVTKEQP